MFSSYKISCCQIHEWIACLSFLLFVSFLWIIVMNHQRLNTAWLLPQIIICCWRWDEEYPEASTPELKNRILMLKMMNNCVSHRLWSVAWCFWNVYSTFWIHGNHRRLLLYLFWVSWLEWLTIAHSWHMRYCHCCGHADVVFCSLISFEIYFIAVSVYVLLCCCSLFSPFFISSAVVNINEMQSFTMKNNRLRKNMSVYDRERERETESSVNFFLKNINIRFLWFHTHRHFKWNDELAENLHRLCCVYCNVLCGCFFFFFFFFSM